MVPSTENPKPVLQGLIHDKNGHFYFYQNGKKLKNRWKKVGKNKYYFGKNGQAVTGKKNISHYLCYFNKKGVLTRKIDKNKKMVALTYDDGPSVYTPTILKTLKKNDSVATFFVVGSRVSTYSKTVQKAYDNGCQIGNHTYDHKILTRVGKKEVQKQVSKTNRAVKKVIGINPVVMRPPGGVFHLSRFSFIDGYPNRSAVCTGPGLYGSGTLPLVGTASFAVFRSEKGAPKEPSWQKFTCTIPSGTAASLFSLLHPVANNPAAASRNTEYLFNSLFIILPINSRFIISYRVGRSILLPDVFVSPSLGGRQRDTGIG